MRSEAKNHDSRGADVAGMAKPVDDAPREEWLRWHLSGRPPRSRQHYETLARILDGVRQSA
jgi:hypothetical protein